MKSNTIFFTVVGLITAVGCGSADVGYYPSYEQSMRRYGVDAKLEAVQLTDESTYPATSDCDCPRIWFENRWVYYYGGSWMYHHLGHWYYYPYFDWYYYGYSPVYYRTPTRRIVSRPSPQRSDGRVLQNSTRPAGEVPVHRPRLTEGVAPSRDVPAPPSRPTTTTRGPSRQRPSAVQPRNSGVSSGSSRKR